MEIKKDKRQTINESLKAKLKQTNAVTTGSSKQDKSRVLTQTGLNPSAAKQTKYLVWKIQKKFQRQQQKC